MRRFVDDTCEVSTQTGAVIREAAFARRSNDAGSELRDLRHRTAGLLAAFVWANVPLAAVVAVAVHGSVAPGIVAAIALAIAATLLSRVAPSTMARLAMTAVVSAVPMLVASVGSGFWHGDWFAYFFVVFALLVAYADWRPIVLAACGAACYALVADAMRPHLGNGSAFERLSVMLFLVVLACAALCWFARQLRRSIRRTESALAAREIFEAIVQKGTAGIGVFTGADGARTLAFANPVLIDQLNYTGNPLGKTTLELVGPEMTLGLVTRLRGGLNEGQRNTLGMFPWTNQGQERWFEIDAYMVAAGDGSQCLIAVTTDVTLLRRVEVEAARARLAEETNLALEREIADRTRAEQRLAHAAYHDALTGLPNRQLLAERLEVALRRAARHPDRSPAVLFVDLDGFKLMNDTFGHTVADLLLIAVARRFESCLRADDTIARIGSDEFVILLESVSEQVATTLGQLLLEALAKPFELAGRDVAMSASIGIAIGSSDYTTVDSLVRDADIAMYRAKTLGKRRCEVFVDEMRVRNDQRTRFGIDLQHALGRDEFTVYYQPIVSLATGELEGFEALVRWQHPTLGLVPPVDFIAVAEETGAIVELGAWVLRTACLQLAAWRRDHAGRSRLSVSVNVSVNQLLTPGFALVVARTLDDARLEASALHVEITETAVVHEPLRVAQELAELRALGVLISIDDFGTGYSSLTYLKTFPLDSLKIDKSFVSDRGDSIGDPEIVRSLIVLAQSLGLAVVAEGVETPEQEAQLRELGCTKAQGYLFARPLTASDATIFMSGSPLPEALQALRCYW